MENKELEEKKAKLLAEIAQAESRLHDTLAKIQHHQNRERVAFDLAEQTEKVLLASQKHRADYEQSCNKQIQANLADIQVKHAQAESRISSIKEREMEVAQQEQSLASYKQSIDNQHAARMKEANDLHAEALSKHATATALFSKTSNDCDEKIRSLSIETTRHNQAKAEAESVIEYSKSQLISGNAVIDKSIQARAEIERLSLDLKKREADLIEDKKQASVELFESKKRKEDLDKRDAILKEREMAFLDRDKALEEKRKDIDRTQKFLERIVKENKLEKEFEDYGRTR